MDYSARWEIINELGKGGQGVVYLVRAKNVGRIQGDFQDEFRTALRVFTSSVFSSTDLPIAFQTIKNSILDLVDPNGLAALKVLHPYDSENARDSSKAEDRLNRELEALERLSSHPNIVTLKDRDKDNRWFVSEYHSQGTLAKYENKVHFKGDLTRSLRVFRTLVDAVAALHKENLVHRDIKPENVFVSNDKEQLILGDFGLVIQSDDDKTRISGTYENVGSWNWMPHWAEDKRIEDINPTFDVFSLGKILWTMLSGKEMLKFWYYYKSENDLVKQFPNDDRLNLINKLLGKCIVEEEKDCLENAEVLLEKIDDLFVELGAHPTPRCLICGAGNYERVANCRDGEGGSIEKFGLKPNQLTNIHDLSCNNCGHTQLFIKPEPNVATGQVGQQPDPWYAVWGRQT